LLFCFARVVALGCVVCATVGGQVIERAVAVKEEDIRGQVGLSALQQRCLGTG
jgi:hypothetical protein